jgi:hypothetical protein
MSCILPSKVYIDDADHKALERYLRYARRRELHPATSLETMIKEGASLLILDGMADKKVEKTDEQLPPVTPAPPPAKRFEEGTILDLVNIAVLKWASGGMDGDELLAVVKACERMRSLAPLQRRLDREKSKAQDVYDRGDAPEPAPKVAAPQPPEEAPAGPGANPFRGYKPFRPFSPYPVPYRQLDGVTPPLPWMVFNPGYVSLDSTCKGCGVGEASTGCAQAEGQAPPADAQNQADELIVKDLRGEEWREYDTEIRVYRINNPQELQYRVDGTTHRIVDAEGVVHCIPFGSDVPETVLRWKNRDTTKPVTF